MTINDERRTIPVQQNQQPYVYRVAPPFPPPQMRRSKGGGPTTAIVVTLVLLAILIILGVFFEQHLPATAGIASAQTLPAQSNEHAGQFVQLPLSPTQIHTFRHHSTH